MLNPTTNTPERGSQGLPEREHIRNRRVFRPNVDILERPDALELFVDMPGADRAATEVTLERDVLTIRAKVDWTTPQGYRPLFREFEIGDYERVFTLSAEVEAARIEAAVKNGVLHLVLPKAEPAKARRIEVKAG